MKVWQHSDAQASRKAFQHPLQRLCCAKIPSYFEA
jgi:hypothetical protein